MQNDAGTCGQDWHKIDTSGLGFAPNRAEKNPGALAGATEAILHKKTRCFHSLSIMVPAPISSREACHGYDRWRIEDLKRELDRIGAEPPLEPFGQGFRDMAPALDKMERLVAEVCLRHAGNPILTFCASNAVVEMDPAGNRKLAKNKSCERIDGMLALAMATVNKKGEETLPACLAELMS